MNQDKDDRTKIRACFRIRKRVLGHVMVCGGEES